MVTQEKIEQTLAVADVTERVKQMALIAGELGATAEIVGKWVWARFDGMPSRETRTLLKQARFRWNPTRRIWQYAGVFRRRSNRSNEEIRTYYGAVRVRTESGERFTVPTASGLTPTHVNGSRVVSARPVRETVYNGEEI